MCFLYFWQKSVKRKTFVILTFHFSSKWSIFDFFRNCREISIVTCVRLEIIKVWNICFSGDKKWSKMNAVNWLICCLLLNFLSLSNCSQISIDPDGGYKNIVVKIDKNVPEDQCTEILKNLKVRPIFQTRRNRHLLRYSRIWEILTHFKVCLVKSGPDFDPKLDFLKPWNVNKIQNM